MRPFCVPTFLGRCSEAQANFDTSLTEFLWNNNVRREKRAGKQVQTNIHICSFVSACKIAMEGLFIRFIYGNGWPIIRYTQGNILEPKFWNNIETESFCPVSSARCSGKRLLLHDREDLLWIPQDILLYSTEILLQYMVVARKNREQSSGQQATYSPTWRHRYVPWRLKTLKHYYIMISLFSQKTLFVTFSFYYASFLHHVVT